MWVTKTLGLCMEALFLQDLLMKRLERYALDGLDRNQLIHLQS